MAERFGSNTKQNFSLHNKSRASTKRQVIEGRYEISKQPEQEQAVVLRLHDSVKIIAVRSCSEHENRAFCDCVGLVAGLSDINKAMFEEGDIRFPWETHLLSNECTFDYLGDQNSHHTFHKACGTTPKHFAREFLKGYVSGHGLVPARKQQETLQCMLDLWIFRNKQWRQRYGTREQAKRQWIHDGCPIGTTLEPVPLTSDPEIREAQAKNARLGRIVPKRDVTCDPPWHRCRFTLVLEGERDKGDFTRALLRVEEVALCHENCERGRQIVREEIEPATSRFLADLGRPRLEKVELVGTASRAVSVPEDSRMASDRSD